MGGVGHVSAARACGRIGVGRLASAGGWGPAVWFVLVVVGVEAVRRGRTRVMAERRINVLKGRGGIVGWRWGLRFRVGAFCLEGILGVRWWEVEGEVRKRKSERNFC